MRVLSHRIGSIGLAGVMLAASVIVPGCGSPPAEFMTNMVYVRTQEKAVGEPASPQQLQDVADVLEAMFGTPDDPKVPALEGVDIAAFLREETLAMAAGPVHSDEIGRPQGLYREHCAHCHGITGDGAGPTSLFLDPYPRDFRMGAFKFKSTPIGRKPTFDDLHQIMIEGIPGTAMPSFRLLPEDELEALIQYVMYLSMRGEVERALIFESVNELDPDERLLDVELQREDPDTFRMQADFIKAISADVINSWLDAENHVVPVPPRPTGMDLEQSIIRGRELYYGTVANCFTCHGDGALGDGQTDDYDDWTKDWTTAIGIDPKDREEVREFLALGAYPPRNIYPRNLRQGIYRGGRRPVDLYWRIVNGIEGTPMPGVPLRPEGAGPEAQGLSQEELWNLIDYVRFLPYEDVSQAGMRLHQYQRERL